MKKILLLMPVVALLAAGCGSSSPQPDSTPSTSQSINQPSSSTTPASSTDMGSMGNMNMAPGSSMWQATLMASNNTAKGKYMIMVSGHTIYLNTGRDYSSLVGKPVNISFTGTTTSFSLGDITAQ